MIFYVGPSHMFCFDDTCSCNARPRHLTTATIATKVEDALAEEDLVLGDMND